MYCYQTRCRLLPLNPECLFGEILGVFRGWMDVNNGQETLFFKRKKERREG